MMSTTSGTPPRFDVAVIGGGNSGLKAFLVPLARKNQRKLDEVARKLDPIIPEIASLAWTDKRAALMLAKEKLAA